MKERKKKGNGVIMINQFKGHLKVLESGRLAGEVSVCNLGGGRSQFVKKKKPLKQILNISHFERSFVCHY